MHYKNNLFVQLWKWCILEVCNSTQDKIQLVKLKVILQLFIKKNSSTFRAWTVCRKCMVSTFPLLHLYSSNSDLGIKIVKLNFKKLWERITQLPLLFQYAFMAMIHLPQSIHCLFFFFFLIFFLHRQLFTYSFQTARKS